MTEDDLIDAIDAIVIETVDNTSDSEEDPYTLTQDELKELLTKAVESFKISLDSKKRIQRRNEIKEQITKLHDELNKLEEERMFGIPLTIVDTINNMAEKRVPDIDEKENSASPSHTHGEALSGISKMHDKIFQYI